MISKGNALVLFAHAIIQHCERNKVCNFKQNSPDIVGAFSTMVDVVVSLWQILNSLLTHGYIEIGRSLVDTPFDKDESLEQPQH